MKYVVLDCDGGSDDAWALLLLLRGEQEGRLQLLGVTVSGCGNTSAENAALNMARMLRLSKRQVPIYVGSKDSLIPKESLVAHPCIAPGLPKFHGEDGFGDVLEPMEGVDVQDIVEKEHAVPAIHRFCCELPGKVTIMAVGPLTNLALCYSMYGEDFAEKVKDIYIMGGNYQGIGNYSRAAEFNFFADAEAAHIVFAKSLCPITLLPWEPCLEDRFRISLSWRLDQFGQEASCLPVIATLNTVERAQYTAFESTTWNPCDALLAAVFLFDSHIVCKESQFHVGVDLTGHTRGLCVLDHLHEVKKYPKNVRIVELVEADFFKRVVRWTAGLEDLSCVLSNVK